MPLHTYSVVVGGYRLLLDLATDRIHVEAFGLLDQILEGRFGILGGGDPVAEDGEQFGPHVEDDGLVVTPVADLGGAGLDTHHDHRLAMAFGLLGLCVDGISVHDPDVVSKSWPGYWAMLDALSGRSV